MNIDCLVISKITDKLSMLPVDKNILKIPENIDLADPTFNIPDDINVLLGANVFYSIPIPGKKVLGQHLPLLQISRFGWIIADNLYSNTQTNVSMSNLVINSARSLDDNLQRFWIIEEDENGNFILSKVDEYCEKHFLNTTRRNEKGRFVVDLPFKESLKNLGRSREMALNRFYWLEKRFNKYP